MQHTQLIRALAATAILTLSLESSALETGSLTIEMEGGASDDGMATFILMDSAASHHGHAPIFAKSRVPIHQGRAQARFDDLPVGHYSAVIYHDANGNDQLDRYFFGLPKERYGFSNNARGNLGIPSFEQSRFEVGAAHSIQSIRVK